MYVTMISVPLSIGALCALCFKLYHRNGCIDLQYMCGIPLERVYYTVEVEWYTVGKGVLHGRSRDGIILHANAQ